MVQSSPILCFGTTPTMQRTLVFEKLYLDRVNRAKNVREFASGKSINAARVVRSLGEQATAVGFAGGPRGQMLRQDLQKIGIEDEMVEVATPTRLCSTLIDESARTATELVEESAAVSVEDWARLDSAMQRVLRLCPIWIFSGSLPPGAPTDTYAKWGPAAQQLGAKMIVDARGEALRLAMQHPGVIVKINREEFQATFEKTNFPAAMINAAPANGAIIVTAGVEGSWLCNETEIHHLPAPKIKVVNPIGSGDAYAAGLAVGLLRKMNLVNACRLGAACAAANAETMDAGHVDQARVWELFAEEK
ncbi:MAG TPA: PfkB family carbohydrate kinase [Tepidisphaeraceae bacterium]|nr:PfkB family carbohydrate kinase [Tepidisphaeraceae bacterium]